MIDYSRTVSKLTATQLQMAAADLDNARLVMKHQGHFRGSLMDQSTAQVCLVGAIDLATYRKPHVIGGHWYAINRADVKEGEFYRAENAILVLADFVPTSLCQECDDDNRGHDLSHRIYCGCQPREAWEIATHFNDAHCMGGTEAQNVLGMARDHAFALAEAKRQAFENLRVAV